MAHFTNRFKMSASSEIYGVVGPRKHGLGKRHVIAALLFLAYVTSCFSRGDISVAVVAMTSANSSNLDFPVFNWTETQKNAALSSYYAGIVIGSSVAGEIIRLVGAPFVLYGSFIAHAALSAITPVITWNGSWLLLTINRALIGIVHGFLDSLLFLVTSRWFPPNERNFLFNLIFMGSALGAALASQLCGFLAAGPFGWPSIFYFAAVPMLLFCILWRLFGAWSPRECKTMSPEERSYIEQCLANVQEKKNTGKTPWKRILKSTAVYAAIIADVGQGILSTIVLNEITLFIDGVHQVNISLNGLLTAIPLYTPLVYLNFIGIGADLLLTKKILTTVQLRKISATLALAANATVLVLYGFVGSSLTAIIVLLAVNYFFMCFAYVGYMTNLLDLSPNYSQNIVGVSRAIENIASFFTPLIFSTFESDKHSLSSWRLAFSVTAAPVYFCYAFFIVFGRVEPQPWDTVAEQSGIDESSNNF